MKLNNKELLIVIKILADLAKDERIGDKEINALEVLSDFVLNMTGKNIVDKFFNKRIINP